MELREEFDLRVAIFERLAVLSEARGGMLTYDRNFIGISPDYRIHIGEEIARSGDEGPIMQHALKDLESTTLTLPSNSRHRPSRDGLAERFDEFRAGRVAPARLDRTWAASAVDVGEMLARRDR